MPKTYQNHLKPEFKELDAAIASGNLAKVKELITSQNINAEIDTYYRNTPLLVANLHDRIEIVKYLLEKKCNVNSLYGQSNSFSALTDAISFYANRNDEIRKNIALILIKEGADLYLPSITPHLARLKQDDHIRILIEKFRELKDCKDDSTAKIECQIGVEYDLLGEEDEAKKWYLKSAKKGNPTGMYNLGQVLIKHKNLREAAQWLLKSYLAYQKTPDKWDAVAKLEQITRLRSEMKENKENDLFPETLYNIFEIIAWKYFQKEDKEEGLNHLFNALTLSEQFPEIPLSPADKKLLQAVCILRENQIKFPSKEVDEKNTLAYTQDHLRITELLHESARLGSASAQNLLIANVNKGPISLKILSCHFLSGLPSLSDKDKKHCEKITTESKDFYNGLKALYGLGRRGNAAEAIKIFENVASNGKYPAVAYLHSAAGHCQIALKTSDDEERSERIAKAVKAYGLIKQHYQDYYSNKKEFSRTELYNQLFLLLSISKNQSDTLLIIKTLLDFYQTEIINKIPSKPRLIAVMTALQKNEFLKSNLEAWKLTLDTLLHCHLQTDLFPRTGIFKTHLQEFVKISESLPPKFQFFAKKALADCYNRYNDHESLQFAIQQYESLNKLAEQAEEKFSLENCRDTYKRFGKSLQSTGSEEAVAAYSKAAELGDVESALHAAAVAELDEKQIDTAIDSYKKAMQDAISGNNIKYIIATLKQILTFKDKLDLSSKRTAQIEAIIYSAQEKLNDKSLIQSYIAELTTLLPLAERLLPQEKISLLFATHSILLKEAKVNGHLSKLVNDKDVVRKLLLEFEKHVAENNSSVCDKIKEMLFDFVRNATDLKIISKIIHSLFEYSSKNKLVINLQNELIVLLEKSFAEKEKKDINCSILLCNLYFKLISPQGIKLCSTDRIAVYSKLIEILKKINLHPEMTERNKLQTKAELEFILMNETDPATLAQTKHALNIITHKNKATSQQILTLVQQNHLPAVYDLFEQYKKPRLLGKEHIRRPLYLAAKILLLTLDKKAAEKRFDLKKPQIDMMIIEAYDKLRTIARTVLKNVNENCETYQYARLANWYLEIIENTKQHAPEDPDAYLLHASLVDQPLYDMEQIRTHVTMGMKQALTVDKNWIKQKLENSSHLSVVQTESKEDSKAAASIKRLSSIQFPETTPSAPLYVEDMESPPKQESPLDESSLKIKSAYPILNAATPVNTGTVSKVSLQSLFAPPSYPVLTEPSAPPVEVNDDEPGSTVAVDINKIEMDKEFDSLTRFFEKPAAKPKPEKKTAEPVKKVVMLA